MKKISPEEFLQRSRLVWGNRWNYDKTNYLKMSEKITLTCPLHGEFSQSPQAHLKGLVGCTECNGQKPLDSEEFIKRLVDAGRGEEFDYSHLTIGRGGIHQRVSLICRAHNELFQANGWFILRGGTGCYKCNKFSRMTEEKLTEKAKELYASKTYDYSKVDFSAGVKTKVLIGCPIESHGFFDQTIDGHLSGKEGCVKCDRANRLMTTDEFIEKSRTLWGNNRYDYSKVDLSIDGRAQGLTLTCLKHGDFSYKINPHLLGLEGCLECRKSFGPSKGEKELADFIESLGLVALRSDRKTLAGKEIDVLVPERSVGFEFNGIYYHSEAFLPKTYHKAKEELSKNAGITLYQIWEDDWNERKEIVKRHVAHIVGKSETRKIYARKTVVKTISTKIARNFLELNHIQGFVGSSVYLGIFFEDTLVAVASFSKTQNDYLLTRYATSVTVVGGHSKLVSYFEENFDYGKLITFADLTFSDGNLYYATGWTEDKVIPPDYHYIVGGRRVHKFGYRLKRFKEDANLLYEADLTEAELAELNGLIRIWDAGKIRFVKPRLNS